LQLDAGWEEYYDYIFPDEAAAQPNLKLLALAKMWKKDAAPKEEEEDDDDDDDDDEEEDEEVPGTSGAGISMPAANEENIDRDDSMDSDSESGEESS
jgi:crooked neck